MAPPYNPILSDTNNVMQSVHMFQEYAKLSQFNEETTLLVISLIKCTNGHKPLEGDNKFIRMRRKTPMCTPVP